MRNVLRNATLIERPRLLQKLQCVTQHRLTLINAPPGYGKTVLVAQFADQSPHPIAWHTLEERERDLATLYRQSLAVLESVAPGIKHLATTYEYIPSELAGRIANYLREALTIPFIYILDDVHNISGSSAAEMWLQTLITCLPPTCHVILISRMLPELRLVELVAKREVCSIEQAELRLTFDEISRLATDLFGNDVDPKHLHELEVKLEGWPAGIVLAFYPLPDSLQQVFLDKQATPEAMFNVLAEVMLEAQPPEIQLFLLSSSILSRFTPEMCEYALGLPNSVGLLAQVRARNLFVTSLPNGYVYHTLFRTFLQTYLFRVKPEEAIHLHLKAAHWFEARDDLDEAFDHYFSAGALDSAAVLAKRVANAYFFEGQTETLLAWRVRLSQQYTCPAELLYICALIQTDRYQYAEAERFLAEAETSYISEANDRGIAQVALQRATIDLHQGRYTVAVGRVNQILHHSPAASFVHPQALNLLGNLHLRLGQLQTAVQNFSEALPFYRTNANAYSLSQLLQSLGATYEKLGQLNRATACLQETISLLRPFNGGRALALALNNLGYYFHLGNDYSQAREIFIEALQIMRHSPDKQAEASVCWSLGDLERDTGNFEEAAQYYYRGLELAQRQDPFLYTALLTSLALLRRWQGDFSWAVKLAQEAITLAQEHALMLNMNAAEAVLWTTKAELDDPNLAQNELENIISKLRVQGATLKLLSVIGMAMHVAFLSASRKIAKQHLQEALQLAQEVGTAQPLAAELFHAKQALSKLRLFSDETNILSEALKTLQQAHRPNISVQAPASLIPSQTYSLRIQTFGQIVVIRDGQLIPASAWEAISAKELFFYLLFGGAKTKAHIALDFWPEGSLTKIHKVFHITLHRARQALGENVLTFEDGRYGLDPTLQIFCDAHELQRLTQKARVLSPHDARAEELWRKVRDLYRGEFLPGMYMKWIDVHRLKLRELYIESLVGMARIMRIRHDFDGAIKALLQATDAEPFQEHLHRELMMCYAETGEITKVLHHFSYLQELLRTEIGTEPSLETQELFQRLLR